MKKLFLIMLVFLVSCQYHPPEKYLRKCGFTLHNGSSPHSNSFNQWLLQDSSFYYKNTHEPIKYILYWPSLNAWHVGVGWEDCVLSGVDIEVNSKREFKALLQDLVNPDSLGLEPEDWTKLFDTDEIGTAESYLQNKGHWGFNKRTITPFIMEDFAKQRAWDAWRYYSYRTNNYNGDKDYKEFEKWYNENRKEEK